MGVFGCVIFSLLIRIMKNYNDNDENIYICQNIENI